MGTAVGCRSGNGLQKVLFARSQKRVQFSAD
jgi:hypothetical protein